MEQPFEGVLGNNCELRIIEFLLPLKDIEFNITELAEEVGVSRPTANRVIKKFISHGLMKVAKEQSGTRYYTINGDSPFVTLLEDLNNLVIEQMLEEETLYQIHDLWQENRIQRNPPCERTLELKPEIKFSTEDFPSPWPGKIFTDAEPLAFQPINTPSTFQGGESNVAG